MSDTLIFARHETRAPLLHVDSPTVPLRKSTFSLERERSSAPVVEVLEAVETDFRQGETSMLQIINVALSKETISRHELLTLRARMRRYSYEVDALAKLVHALVGHLREQE